MSDERLETARRRLLASQGDEEIAAWLMEQRRAGRPYRFGHVETLSPSTWRTCESVRALLESSRPLLLLGEAGAGRTRLARSVHDLGPRSSGPWFASESCSSMSLTALERELFGSVQTGIGGQIHDRRGLFARMAGGTLLLRDIDEAGEAVARILGGVLAEGTFRQVGRLEPTPFDVRVLLTASKLSPGLSHLCDVVAVPPLRGSDACSAQVDDAGAG